MKHLYWLAGLGITACDSSTQLAWPDLGDAEVRFTLRVVGASVEVLSGPDDPSDEANLSFEIEDPGQVYVIGLGPEAMQELTSMDPGFLRAVQDPSLLRLGAPECALHRSKLGPSTRAVRLVDTAWHALEDPQSLPVEVRIAPQAVPSPRGTLRAFGGDSLLVPIGLRVDGKIWQKEHTNLFHAAYLDEDRVVAVSAQAIFAFERGRTFDTTHGFVEVPEDLELRWAFALTGGELTIVGDSRSADRYDLLRVGFDPAPEVREIRPISVPHISNMAVTPEGWVAVDQGVQVWTATGAAGPYQEVSNEALEVTPLRAIATPGQGPSHVFATMGRILIPRESGELEALVFDPVVGPNFVPAAVAVRTVDGQEEIWVGGRPSGEGASLFRYRQHDGWTRIPMAVGLGFETCGEPDACGFLRPTAIEQLLSTENGILVLIDECRTLFEIRGDDLTYRPFASEATRPFQSIREENGRILAVGREGTVFEGQL